MSDKKLTWYQCETLRWMKTDTWLRLNRTVKLFTIALNLLLMQKGKYLLGKMGHMIWSSFILQEVKR